ncbi:hypothetical protein KPL71_014795 [Citrus sinensis]|uniref:Uncharacterized protein n=1 Tax=Citrus sinensis TaxID=2711 RepID=A0ACB8KE62_CITSI|nr:hypothetical protein KPL71_014795 [Citrus sinensis]
MATQRLDVEKFTGENDFHLWRLKMRALLVHQGIEEVLEDPRTSKKISKVKDEDMQEAMDKAHNTIILSLGDGVLREVGDQTTTAGLWKKLEDLYTKKSLTKRLSTKKRLYTLQMEEGSSLTTHIDAFNRIILDLEDINVKIEDEDKAIILLSSLPSSYEHFVDTLLYGRQSLAMQDFKEALSSKESSKKSETKDGEGLSVRGRSEKRDGWKGKKKGRSKSKNSALKCFHCHKEGHFKRDCPERKIKPKDANNRSGNAAVASEDSDEGYDSAGVLVASNMQTEGKWVLDSGCTYHMCPHKNLFSSYQPFEGGKVLMGNNASCKVIGIGSVRLKMSDGIIRELDNVRHIPELKRNLISLSMLDKAGCCIRLESSSLKVIKGSLILMKGVMQHGLYILQGSAITGDVGVVIKQELDKTLLWHFRLGHVSESGLKELEKQGALGSDKISTVGFCEECVLGKSSRTRFKTAVHNTKGTLDYIHSDMWGPAQIESLGGACYFLSMIDDFSRMFDDLCEKSGIQRHKTVRHTPQQNGLAERMNRTLMERVRCMLFHSKLLKTLWAETLCTACYLINRCPSTAIELKTPYEVWSGRLADYTKLRIFGCTAYAHIKQGKLEPRALKCAFLGYPSGTKGYRLWCVDLKPPKCIISRDVIFNESEMLKNQTSTQSSIQKIPSAETPHFEVELSKTEDDQNTSHTGETQGSDETSAQTLEHISIQDYQLTRDRQKRQIKAPERLGYADLIAYALTAAQEVDQEEPKTYEEAIACKESTQWIKAMEDEMDSLNKNGTWKLIQKTRRKEDVKTAFLHGDLQEEIVMSQPEGFVNTQHPDWVCLLQKSLYGLKQSPRQWYLKFDSYMQELNFQKSSYDCCVYLRKTYGEEVIYLVLYVDDMLLASKSMKLINLLKQQLRDKFDMKDLGPAKKILGVEMIRNRTARTLFLSQEKYVNKILEKFGMLNCKPVSTPMAAHFRLSSQQCPSTESEQTEMLKTPYANSVGCLMYAMVLTRPDLSYAVSLVSRFMSNPGKEHWRAVKWILRYLKGITRYGLLYGGERANYNLVEGSVDSDYAGDLDNRRSLTGFLFTLNNCTISWKASLQSVVALSTTEAEYTAAVEAFKEAIWLRGMINELGYQQTSIPILCDSQSAISLSKNQVHHEKTKHIDIKLHFIRLEVSKGTVKLVKVHTTNNVADMLTKPVPMAKFEHCLDLAGICRI